jgi:hypothetical protein
MNMKKGKGSDSKKTLISIFIVVIMVASSLGILLSGYAPQANEISYGNHIFKQDGNYLVTTINKTKVRIQSYPSDLEGIKVDEAVAGLVSSAKAIYVSYPINGTDTNTLGMAAQAGFDMGDYLDSRGVYTMLGVSDTNQGHDAVPLLDCRNATAASPAIVFGSGNESSITAEGYCVRISGVSGYDFIRLKDRLILKIAGVMN